MADMQQVTADDLTDEMIWQVVMASADERNAVLLGYCAVALRQKTGGGLRHAREVLCKAINAAIGALNARAKSLPRLGQHLVTADTITDEQIEALRVEAAHAGDIRVATDCTGALLPGLRSTCGLLRERCASAYNRYADAINARAKAVR